MKSSSLSLFILLTLLITATAQEPAKPVAPDEMRGDKPTFALPEFMVEVQRHDGCVFSPVVPKQNSGFLLYALPRPRNFPTDRSGQPIISKVFVTAKQIGEFWDVKVFVGKGEFYDAGDFKVGEFRLTLNQRVTVPEVSRFGLTPIRVGVVKIIRDEADKPYFRSLARSISVESIEAKNLPEPYKVKLKNNSPNDLVAIQYNSHREHKFIGLKWFSPGHLKPMMKSGETYEFAVSSEDNTCGDVNGYRPGQSDQVELVSAVFADGTYEGQTGLAALIKGTAFGNRRQLERVMETIRFYTDADPAEVVSQLNYLQEAMTEETQPYMAESVRMMIPSLPADAASELNSFIRSGMHEVKVSLMRDVQYFQSLKREDNSLLNQEWLKQTIKKYKRWLTAAERMTSQ